MSNTQNVVEQEVEALKNAVLASLNETIPSIQTFIPVRGEQDKPYWTLKTPNSKQSNIAVEHQDMILLLNNDATVESILEAGYDLLLDSEPEFFIMLQHQFNCVPSDVIKSVIDLGERDTFSAKASLEGFNHGG